MALQNIYSAESWQKVYTAFDQVNFSSFDFNTIKQSLIEYTQIYYAETFNDLIESSEFIQLIESFAYIAEQLSYRIDMLSHEAFISTAQRKQSILKLVKLISYVPTRNIPARGLVKVTSISTSQTITDVNGNNLANQTIIWNDANNSNWKSQFFLILNQTITGTFGQYNNSVSINEVNFQTYTFNNTSGSLNNGVSSFTVDTGLATFPMEVVSCDIDANGPYEKNPDINAQLSFVYTSDGLGDSSDYTGFNFLLKQGTLSQLSYAFSDYVPNRSIDINLININDSDVWLNQVDNTGTITSIWEQVQTLLDQNIYYNTNTNRNKFEVETLENDQVRLLFGDGDYSNMPYGQFTIWVRQSLNQTLVIQPNNIVNQKISFQYTSPLGNVETLIMTFSLLSAIQNSAPSETIEHIRQMGPSTHYSQNRMVNAEDYNTFMLKDQSILRLNSINRTFAGQPKYIDWNDASGQYQNIKLFGDDLTIGQSININTINTDSTISGRNLIDNIIEPLLSSDSIINLLNWINITNSTTSGVVSIPRRQFIQDNNSFYWSDPLSTGKAITRTNNEEKTLIQGAIDRHFYGEPLSYTFINNLQYATIQNPVTNTNYDGNIWSPNIPRTIDGINPYIPGDTGCGLQPIASQLNFGLRFNNSSPIIGTSISFNSTIKLRMPNDTVNFATEVYTIEIAANNSDIFVSSNIQGPIGTGQIGIQFSTLYPNASIDFLISQNSATYALYHGDVILITLPLIAQSVWNALTSIEKQYSFTTDNNSTIISQSTSSDILVSTMNILGRWEIINAIDLVGTSVSNINPNSLPFDPTQYINGKVNPNSWVIWVQNVVNPVTQATTNFIVNFRELSIQVSSPTTNFWYNSNQILLDTQTQNVVYDQIRLLRSNLAPDGKPIGYIGQQSGNGKLIGHNENYAVVGPVQNSDGSINSKALQVVAPDILNVTPSADMLPTDILQFENFVDAGNNASYFYQYFELDQYNNPISGTTTSIYPSGAEFNPGGFISINPSSTGGITYGRILQRDSLDFMWQHFTGDSNLIDPSVSNIVDTYLITNGYYQNMLSYYVTGTNSYIPVAPTPLELRNNYGYLLNQAMMSDTVVLHSGTFKLLFGINADPQLRGTFYAVQSPTAKLSIENLKNEILTVINAYFDISNWNFGQSFYVTELTSLIHQRLPTEISTIVLVPSYAVNAFGSLYTVQAGIDEILMSCAQLNDIQVVAELNPTILRQGNI